MEVEVVKLATEVVKLITAIVSLIIVIVAYKNKKTEVTYNKKQQSHKKKR